MWCSTATAMGPAAVLRSLLTGQSHSAVPICLAATRSHHRGVRSSSDSSVEVCPPDAYHVMSDHVRCCVMLPCLDFAVSVHTQSTLCDIRSGDHTPPHGSCPHQSPLVCLPPKGLKRTGPKV